MSSGRASSKSDPGASRPVGSSEASSGRRWVAPLFFVALALLAIQSYKSVFALGHCGWDTWPLIETSRIRSGADFVDTFTEELMDGRYPLGRFYRPATNLAFAFDYARAGTESRAYHQTDVAIVLLCMFALYGLARRLFGSAAVALAAAACFALHPLHFEALPVSARRADTLSVAFTLVACWIAARGTHVSRRRALALGLAALVAVGSKETGVLVVPLVFGARCFARSPGAGADAASLSARTWGALRDSLPALGAVLFFVLARTLVLGGLGGHPDSSIVGGLTRSWGLAPGYARDLLVPQPWSPLARGPLAGVLGVALVVGVVAVTLAGGAAERRETRGVSPGGRGAPRALLFVLFWALCTLVVTGMSGETQTWYGIPMLAPYALLVGWVLGRGAELLLARRLVAGALGVATAGPLFASHVAFSGLVRDDSQWPALDSAVQGFLERAGAAAAALRPGQAAQLQGLPLWLETEPEAVGVRSASGIEGYGVQAWFDVERAAADPNACPVRVVALHRLRRNSAVPKPGPDEIVLYVSP